MAFLTRYVDDRSNPGPGSAAKDALLRAVAPAVLLFGAIVGFGLLLKGPLAGFGRTEESLNKTAAQGRTPTWNQITMFWSHIGNTEYVIAVAVLVALLVLWRTKEWWYALVPVLAISLQATVFVIATAVVGRGRPEVQHLDPAPPTSSYPSGHEGAATALYVTFAFMVLSRVRNAALRTVLVVLCLAVPFLVGYARIYRGMHHPSDVAVGFLNGLVSAVLAWLYLRRGERRDRDAGRRDA